MKIETQNQKHLQDKFIYYHINSAYCCFPVPYLQPPMTQYGLLVYLPSCLSLEECLTSWVVWMIELLLRHCCFWVHLGDDVSSWHTQKNVAHRAQSWLNTLQRITNDLPYLRCHKLAYADDICWTTQVDTFAELECTLTADLARVTPYCQK